MEDCFRVYILHWPPFLCHSSSAPSMEKFDENIMEKSQQNNDNFSCSNCIIVGNLTYDCLLLFNIISILQCWIWATTKISIKKKGIILYLIHVFLKIAHLYTQKINQKI